MDDCYDQGGMCVRIATQLRRATPVRAAIFGYRSWTLPTDGPPTSVQKSL